MTPLPIDASLPQIIEALTASSLVLLAPAGSGKTTRVPPAILDSGLLSPEHPNLVVLEPRRIAARAAAARIAQERGWRLGDQVGYHVRFEKRFGSATRLRFLTEGILIRQILTDPFLETVGCVILDEFHERSLNTDLALAFVNEVKSQVRPDLIVVAMSATLEAGPIATFLGGCPVITAEGKHFPVEVEYRPKPRPASPEAIAPLIEELLDDPRGAGHVLVFLPGLAEIRRLIRKLELTASRADAVVLPLHGSLPAEDQDRAMAPSDRRKVILSTNVAETSVTIDGVSVVVDSGLARTVDYDPMRGIDRWELKRISRASADQRAGRAGRTGPGRCIRLWSEREERGLAPFELPEIHRVDLSGAVLALYAWGARSPAQFGWFDPPASGRLDAAENLLWAMEAVQKEPPRIARLGEAMLDWAIHPRLARLMVAATNSGRGGEGAAIAALLSERDILIREQAAARGGSTPRRVVPIGPSDILVRLDLLADAEAKRFSPSLREHGIDPWVARQVVRVRDELLRVSRSRRSGEAAPYSTRGVEGEGDPPWRTDEPVPSRGSDRASLSQPARTTHGNPPPATAGDEEELLKWLLLAYPDRVVRRRGAPGTGQMVGGRGVRLSPQSVVQSAELFLALDAREERRGGTLEIQVNLASLVRLEWLEELFPHHLRRERRAFYDQSRQRIVASTQLFYQDLLLQDDSTGSVDRDEAGPILAEALRPLAESIFRDNPSAAQWLARLDFARQAIPELSWPSFDGEALGELLGEVCQGKTGREQVENTDLKASLANRLDRILNRELREGAPETLALPNGRQARLAYEPGRPPVLAVRLQELFGWTETPRVARGRVPVLLHLLGPNYRPVQITDDLRSFWTETYHQVRKDLRGRYPKHAWPEDPFAARAQPYRKQS
jgi:ATP-dependent helicase HrpB